MIERSVLFSDEMVCAVLAGRKTQIRRVCEHDRIATVVGRDSNGELSNMVSPVIPDWQQDALRNICPYGKPGDRLWVRETWRAPEWYDDLSPRDIPPIDVGYPEGSGIRQQVWYDATRDFGGHFTGKKRPPLHMPRWASRITLELMDVYVERLWDITEEDALAEGFDAKCCESVFNKIGGRTKWAYMRWLTAINYGESLDVDFCEKCARLAVNGYDGKDRCGRPLKIEANIYEIDGWDDSPECDGPRWCEICGVLLHHSLTKCGVENELYLDDDRSCWPVTGQCAAILGNLAGGIGDLGDEHIGRLAQIGFASTWDATNAKRGYSWVSNPWVWRIEFKVCDA